MVKATKINRYFALGLAINTIFLWGFSELAVKLLKNNLYLFDKMITNDITMFNNPLLTKMMILFTLLGSWGTLVIITLLVTVYWVRCKNKVGDAIFLLVTLIGSWLFNELLKWIFHRARPDIFRLITAFGYSFPSGHSMISFAFYGMLSYLIWVNAESSRVRYLGIGLLTGLVIAIGISRVYFGVHYPSDVLAGYAAGGCG